MSEFRYLSGGLSGSRAGGGSGGRSVVMTVEETRDETTVCIDGSQIGASGIELDDRYVTFTAAGRRHRLLYFRQGRHIHIAVGGHTFELQPDEQTSGGAQDAEHSFLAEITAPMPGKILDIEVEVGAEIDSNTALVLMEAMKMETTLRAPAAAKVTEILVSEGAMVAPGDVLIRLAPLED